MAIFNRVLWTDMVISNKKNVDSTWIFSIGFLSKNSWRIEVHIPNEIPSGKHTKSY